MVSPLAGRGVSAGWRPVLADELLRATRAGAVAWTEAVAENLDPARLPEPLVAARASGLAVVPHGVTLGLAGAAPPAPARLRHLARLATVLDAPLVSEHVAFVRAGDGGADALHADVGDLVEAGHLVPAARTTQSLGVLVDNVRIAQAALPVPLALENVAATLAWPETSIDEADFLTELVDATGCLLLLDVANVYATCSALGPVLGGSPRDLLDRVPWASVAYLHVAGGFVDDAGTYLDSHGHDMVEPVLDLLTYAVERAGDARVPVLLERDSDVSVDVVRAELARVRTAVAAARVPAVLS